MRVLKGADVCFITVGIPSAPDGSADLSYVESAARSVGRGMSGSLLTIVKSTVPVGTNARVRDWIASELEGRSAGFGLSMASNPEFLREGAALRDFLEPDRVVLGTDSPEAREIVTSLYSFLEPSRLLFMDIASAEMAKYVKMHGMEVAVRCRVVRDEEFSVHADASELLDWVGTLKIGRAHV